MLFSKCQRSFSSEGDATLTLRNAQRSKLAPLASFFSLPLELQLSITELACFSSSSSIKSTSVSQQLYPCDAASVRSLSLVCHQMNNLIAKQLWRDITITRPSSLYALHSALGANPERAKLIATLHIGPQDILPNDWWPLRKGVIPSKGPKACGKARRWFACSLERARLPIGCEDDEVWQLDGSPSGCLQVAVRDALRAAQVSLGANLLNEGMPLSLQLEVIFEEDKESKAQPHLRCAEARCYHYPLLFIKPSPPTPLSPPIPAGAYILNRPQLLRHIARRGATTDRFDHPLILVRSGFELGVEAPLETTRMASGTRWRVVKDNWNIGAREKGVWPGIALLRGEAEAAAAGNELPNAALTGTATLGEVFSLTRAVLQLASNVETLSLTGFLPDALNGHQAQPSLRRLSLAPLLPHYYSNRALAGLDQIEDLRVCGIPLREEDVWTITRKMPRLRNLQLRFEERLVSSFGFGVVQVIDSLAKGRLSAYVKEEAKSRGVQLRREDGNGRDDPEITIRLHPEDVLQLLENVPAETRLAWSEGRAAAGHARPIVLENDPAATGACIGVFEEGMLWRRQRRAM